MKNPLSKSKQRAKRVGLILAAAILSYVILSMAGSAIVFRVIFSRTNTVNAFELTYSDVSSDDYPRGEVSFYSGENRLYGCVYHPKSSSAGLVLVVNGINSCIDRHLPEILRFIDGGFSVMTFENTGVGKSEGSGTVGIAQARLDVVAAIEYIRSDSRLSALPLVLYGHSLGGYAAATALLDEDNIRAAVCVSGFNSPNENMAAGARKYVGLLADLQYPFMCLQNYFLFGDKSDSTAVSAINSTDVPVMIVGGSGDETVTRDISILEHADEITNPNAVIVEISDEYRCGHSTVWLSRDSAKYLTETENPDNKELANQTDREFINGVLSFYRSAIAASGKTK